MNLLIKIRIKDLSPAEADTKRTLVTQRIKSMEGAELYTPVDYTSAASGTGIMVFTILFVDRTVLQAINIINAVDTAIESINGVIVSFNWR